MALSYQEGAGEAGLAVPSDLQIHTLVQVGNRHLLIIEIHHCLFLEHSLNLHVISYVPCFKGNSRLPFQVQSIFVLMSLRSSHTVVEALWNCGKVARVREAV